jgi:hypothetical protein
MLFIVDEQPEQKVHSNVQMCASASGASCVPHFSQLVFISSDMSVWGLVEFVETVADFCSNRHA